MKRIVTILIGTGLVLVLTGCGPRSMVVLVPDPDGKVGQLVVKNDGGQRTLSEANQSVKISDRKARPGEVTTLSDEEIRSTFGDAMAARPLQPARFILYFLQGSDHLSDESRALIRQIIQTVQERSPCDIIIAGHTDTVGEKEYNYRLALDRAELLHRIMVAEGVTSSNITVTSHGEGNPLVRTADGVEEPRNRRVEVVIK